MEKGIFNYLFHSIVCANTECTSETVAIAWQNGSVLF